MVEAMPHDDETVGESFDREELHVRAIDLRGYRRSDGLFEVEGRLTDRKPFAYVPAGGEREHPADEPIHDMGLRLVFDDDMVVKALETYTRSAPYSACPFAGQALQSLTGLKIGPGWNRAVRDRLGGALSCTHLVELLSPLATVAIQTMAALRTGRPDPVDEAGRPRQINSCFAYAAGGEVVARRWPAFHEPGS